jgi:hypothetical protein
MSNILPLTGYEIDLLEAARVDINKNHRFFEMAKAILREARFDGLLAEAKGDALEGRKATKNPTARLIHRIMEAISVPTNSANKPGADALDNGESVRSLFVQRDKR